MKKFLLTTILGFGIAMNAMAAPLVAESEIYKLDRDYAFFY